MHASQQMKTNCCSVQDMCRTCSAQIEYSVQLFRTYIAKLSPSFNPSWAELVIISINPATHPPDTPEKSLKAP